MTSDELEMRIGDIDPRLGIKPSLDPKVITFNDETIYSFIEKLFSFNGLIHFIQRGDVGASKWFALQRTILEYWTSKDSQTISNDSKNENGSTAAFSKPASKDSQKKPKEKLIYEFVDEVINHGFTVEQTLLDQKTTSIEIGIKDISDNLLLIDMGLLDRAIFPIEINKMGAMELNLDRSIKFSWLLDQANQLIKKLEQ